MVGTMWVWVIRSASTRRSESSAVQCVMSVTPMPFMSGMASENASGAAWYSGPVQR